MVRRRPSVVGMPGQGGAPAEPGLAPSYPAEACAVADAASLGLSALAEVLARTDYGVAVLDADRHYVYSNPAACHMLGFTFEQLLGQDFLFGFEVREHATLLARLARDAGDTGPLFSCVVRGPGSAEHEVVCSIRGIAIAGKFHSVVIFRDLTGPRGAVRTAAALSQTTAQLVGAGSTNDILVNIARHAVESTRALGCGIGVEGHDQIAAPARGYGFPFYLFKQGQTGINNRVASGADQITSADLTGGMIKVGDRPDKPIVESHARSVWEANPATKHFAEMLEDVDWQAAVYVPLSWENRVSGVLCVYLPAWTAGPTETELVFYTALADQAAVAVINARLTSQAKEAGALLERTHLAREMHDSVSQALFSMTMHTRAAQLLVSKMGLDANGPLGRSIAQLAELTRGALAEMRALIFELRPGALAEEGLVAALGKQAAAVTDREHVAITVNGPEPRLELEPGVEEHLYRIVSEALHNVVKHAHAHSAVVSVAASGGGVWATVRDNGIGFDADSSHPGHLGLLTMTQRAEAIGADLTITSAAGCGTTVAVSLPPTDKRKRANEAGEAKADLDSAPLREVEDVGPAQSLSSTTTEPSRRSGVAWLAEPGDRGGPTHVPAGTFKVSALTDASSLGLSALAHVVADAHDGIIVIDSDRRYVYANPAACRMLGRSIRRLRGHDFLDSFPLEEHAAVVGRLPQHPGDAAPAFACAMLGADDAQREVVCSTFAIEIAERLHGVAIFHDLTGPRVAARTATALAQTTAQLVGTGTTSQILTGIAQHAVEGTRALSCGIIQVGDDHKLASAGGYGPDGPAYGLTNPAWIALADTRVEEAIEAMTAGTITFAEPPGEATVVPDARSIWERNPLTKPFAANVQGLDWQGGVYVSLTWENRVIGFLAVALPSGLPGPSETELAFLSALADQASVAVINTRFASQARQTAALLERARLARELHDSVSQALFSMTMHARAAQLSMGRSGVDETGPLGRSVAQLAELTRSALAEMQTLIFELRPGALAEEGLLGALRKQGTALTARGQVAITVDGPIERLELRGEVEEHLYRIISEALHDVVKHAHADHATVIITNPADTLLVVVTDDGAGFKPDAESTRRRGLSTMTRRARDIGATLTISSTPGVGTTVTVSLHHDRREPKRTVPNAS